MGLWTLVTELQPLGPVLGMVGRAVPINLPRANRERTELICSRLTFSYVKKPNTRLLGCPCRCTRLPRQSPHPRLPRTPRPPTRLGRGSASSPRWTTSPSSCRSQWVCGCSGMDKAARAFHHPHGHSGAGLQTAWLCCLMWAWH